MNNLTARARLFILGTIFFGVVLAALELAAFFGRPEQALLVLVVAALAALAQVLKVEGATTHSNYNIAFVAYGFAFVLLGAPAAVIVMLVGSLVEWFWHRYPWYIQIFNIAQLVVAAAVAGYGYELVLGSGQSGDLAAAAAIVAGTAIFTGVNHLMVGLVLRFARGESLSESGVFDRLTLAIDATLFAMGGGAALIWLVNPFGTLLAVIPIYLIYSTLRVPALQRQAVTDPKTGLFNARYFTEALEKEMARADRFNRPMTVVMADLDLLRNINNTYGHLAGDAVLAGVARVLQQSMRDYDIVARFGGEEFAVMLPETEPQMALQRVENIRMAIEAATFEVSTSVAPIRATMSFGLSGRQAAGESPNEVVHRADLALYQAKLNGRNRAYVQYEAGGMRASTPSPAAVAGGEPLPPPPGIDRHVPDPAPPRPDTAPAARPAPAAPLAPRPAWHLPVFVAVLAVTAASLFVAMWGLRPAGDPLGLLIFAVIAVLTEWLAIEIYVHDTSVSTSAALLVAGVLLFGPVGALALSLALAITAMVKHRSPPIRFVFNFANQLLAGLLVVALVRLTGVAYDQAPFLGRAAVAVIAAGIVYLSTTWLVALVMFLSGVGPARQTWIERFSWLAGVYLGLGLAAFALIFGYANAGLLGVLTVLVPLLILRYSQDQYVSRTAQNVAQLRATNAELNQRAQEISALNDELLLALAAAIDLRDPYVLGHSKHVARYATLIGEQMGLTATRLELLRKAGLLHDVGKIGIPERILFKPGRLDEQEYAIIKLHVTLGTDILEICRSLRPLIPFIRHHHERFDGQGYPDRLRGDEIPLEARILSLADAIEAMASDRPYRAGSSLEAIVEEVRRHTGSQFDPVVAAAFMAVVERRGADLIINSARTLDGAANPSAAVPHQEFAAKV